MKPSDGHHVPLQASEDSSRLWCLISTSWWNGRYERMPITYYAANDNTFAMTQRVLQQKSWTLVTNRQVEISRRCKCPSPHQLYNASGHAIPKSKEIRKLIGDSNFYFNISSMTYFVTLWCNDGGKARPPFPAFETRKYAWHSIIAICDRCIFLHLSNIFHCICDGIIVPKTDFLTDIFMHPSSPPHSRKGLFLT